MADAVTASSSAAAATLPVRATALNAWSARKGDAVSVAGIEQRSETVEQISV
jgi:hypothetical protein